jgi:hypothetical protein
MVSLVLGRGDLDGSAFSVSQTCSLVYVLKEKRSAYLCRAIQRYHLGNFGSLLLYGGYSVRFARQPVWTYGRIEGHWGRGHNIGDSWQLQMLMEIWISTGNLNTKV